MTLSSNFQAPYPVNLLRNVALENVRTSHVLVIDVDMSPSKSLRTIFQEEYLSIKRDNGGRYLLLLDHYRIWPPFYC